MHQESHGQRSLVGYSPWGCQESDTTKHTVRKLNSSGRSGSCYSSFLLCNLLLPFILPLRSLSSYFRINSEKFGRCFNGKEGIMESHLITNLSLRRELGLPKRDLPLGHRPTLGVIFWGVYPYSFSAKIMESHLITNLSLRRELGLPKRDLALGHRPTLGVIFWGVCPYSFSARKASECDSVIPSVSFLYLEPSALFQKVCRFPEGNLCFSEGPRASKLWLQH